MPGTAGSARCDKGWTDRSPRRAPAAHRLDDTCCVAPSAPANTLAHSRLHCWRTNSPGSDPAVVAPTRVGTVLRSSRMRLVMPRRRVMSGRDLRQRSPRAAARALDCIGKIAAPAEPVAPPRAMVAMTTVSSRRPTLLVLSRPASTMSLFDCRAISVEMPQVFAVVATSEALRRRTLLSPRPLGPADPPDRRRPFPAPEHVLGGGPHQLGSRFSGAVQSRPRTRMTGCASSPGP